VGVKWMWKRGRRASELWICWVLYVSPVVVHDQVHIEVLRHLGLDALHGLEELVRAMAPMQLSDHFPGGHVQGCEEGRGPMSPVIELRAHPGPNGRRSRTVVQIV
jgi:hypothetical protein